MWIHCDPAGKKARQINGLINEWYLEDLSGNVRAVLDHKRRSGSYIASFALYGYRKDPKNHSRLLPDEPAAQVVRQIFALYLQGNGAGRIAQTLNAQGVPPPSAYRAVSAGRPRPTPAPLWCKATVRRILSTQTYAGDLEQGRVRKLNYKSRRVIRLPREDWIIVPAPTCRSSAGRILQRCRRGWRRMADRQRQRATRWPGLSGAVSAEARWS